jgi:hypothetical protein
MTNSRSASDTEENTVIVAKVSKGDAKRLLDAFNNGELAAFGILSVEQMPADLLKDNEWIKRYKRDVAERSR